MSDKRRLSCHLAQPLGNLAVTLHLLHCQMRMRARAGFVGHCYMNHEYNLAASRSIERRASWSRKIYPRPKKLLCGIG